MTKTKIVAAVVMADFVALNLYALHSEGIAGALEVMTPQTWWEGVVLMDLVIAIVIAMGWIWRDALSRGEKPVAVTLLTMMTGSVGPLLYLLRRQEG